MQVLVNCPDCCAHYLVAPRLIGRRAACPRCHRDFLIDVIPDRIPYTPEPLDSADERAAATCAAAIAGVACGSRDSVTRPKHVAEIAATRPVPFQEPRTPLPFACDSWAAAASHWSRKFRSVRSRFIQRLPAALTSATATAVLALSLAVAIAGTVTLLSSARDHGPGAPNERQSLPCDQPT